MRCWNSRGKINARRPLTTSSFSRARSRISRFRRLRRCRHIELRHQSFRGQGSRPAGSLSGASAGGRFAVSDVVTRGQIPENLRENALLWIGCIAGALDESDYRAKLAAAGFDQIGIEPTRVYDIEDAREFLTEKGVDVDAVAAQVDGKFLSAFVRATKPAAPTR